MLPATSLARAAAVQRIAGINTQRPWAPYESGMKGHQGRPLSAATGGSTVGEAVVDDVVPSINDAQVVSSPAPVHALARRGATKRDAPVRTIAWERADLPSTRPIRRSRGNPHGCWISFSRFTVNSKIDLTGNFRRELSATFLPSDLPSD